mmetsp:Transcript_17358/g.43637  ORF Transcript_17358/g.43637 Transcript_17358/m.43637 type:complete len:83 (+) Transcript_17358:50-298(+)
MANDGRLVAHLHRPAVLLDIVDDEWRQETLGYDDFDLPSAEFDSDNDEGHSIPKRTDNEKWGDLSLDEFQQPRRQAPAGGLR